MGRRAGQHHGIRGSAALATQPIAPAAVPAEALEPGEMRRLPFAGELLGAARVRSGFVAIPADAFDEAGPALPAEAQAAYLHLLRLSFGEGRNWCRAHQAGAGAPPAALRAPAPPRARRAGGAAAGASAPPRQPRHALARLPAARGGRRSRSATRSCWGGRPGRRPARCPRRGRTRGQPSRARSRRARSSAPWRRPAASYTPKVWSTPGARSPSSSPRASPSAASPPASRRCGEGEPPSQGSMP